MYRVVDKFGDTIDFYLSPTRNTKAAKRFPGKALKGLRSWEQPRVINTDKAPTYAAALAELKQEGKCPKDVLHRQAARRQGEERWRPGRKIGEGVVIMSGHGHPASCSDADGVAAMKVSIAFA